MALAPSISIVCQLTLACLQLSHTNLNNRRITLSKKATTSVAPTTSREMEARGLRSQESKPIYMSKNRNIRSAEA